MTQYIKTEMPNFQEEGTKRCCYRVASRGVIEQDELLEQMCRYGRSGITVGAAKAVLIQLAEVMQYYLANGHSVRLDDIGSFSLSLGLKEGRESEELDGDDAKRNARSLHVKGVNFRANKQFLRDINRACKLELGGTSRMNRSPFSKEERINKAVEFIKTHSYMRVDDYVSLTRLPKSTATRELHDYAHSDGALFVAKGRRAALVYVLAQPQHE